MTMVSVILKSDGTAIAFGEKQDENETHVIVGYAPWARADFDFIDGLPPDEVSGKWKWIGSWQEIPNADPALADFRIMSFNAIEDGVMAVYQKPNILAREYLVREAQAQAYKDADYTGMAGQYVVDFATYKGISLEAATDLVLSQAANFRAAEPALADIRMRKYAVQRCDTMTEASSIHNAAMTALAGVIASIS